MFYLVGVSIVRHHRPEAVLSGGHVDRPEAVSESGDRVIRKVCRRRRLPLLLLTHLRLPLRLRLLRHRPLPLDQLLDVLRLVGRDPVRHRGAVGAERDSTDLLGVFQEVLEAVEAEIPVRNVPANHVSVFA